MKKQFILGELFSGPGGIAAGALKAVSDDGQLSIKHGWANDFDSDSCKTYSENIFGGETDKVICKDVRDLDIKSLSKIDAFAYGFPCNSFSGVGKQQGFENEKFGMLYQYGVDVLNHFQPDWFLAENVSGIRSAGKGSNFQTILQDLENCGYHLVTHLY